MGDLIVFLGWPALLMLAVFAAMLVPFLIQWLRFEIRLGRRLRGYAPHRSRNPW